MIITLTGFMGCGKSSVGRILSTSLPEAFPDRAFHFLDLDESVSGHAGKAIPAIFSEDGEEHFRRLEHVCLQEATEQFLRHPKEKDGRESCLILSLGGGTVLNPACFHRVRRKTCCIYLRGSVDTLAEHLRPEAADRPLLGLPSNGSTDLAALRSRIEILMEARRERYESVARHIIDIDRKTPVQIAREIRLWLNDFFRGRVR